MWVKDQKYLLKGILLFGLFLLIATSISMAKPDNTLYPLTNYFAFDSKGALSSGIENRTVRSESGMKIHEVMSETDVYKYRFIFSPPDYQFETVSIRLRMIFSEDMTNYIMWGNLHNITVNIYPFELATLNGVNGSVQIINALDLYQGTTIKFNLNNTVFDEEEFFELAFSSWNGSESMKGVQFEQIRFHLEPTNILSGQMLFVLISTFSIVSITIVRFRHPQNIFVFMIAFIFFMGSAAMILQANNILTAIPQKEKGVSHFTFFNCIYERREYDNGYYSIKMIKDLSKAFELQASSGTGAQIVYPKIDTTTENSDLELLSKLKLLMIRSMIVLLHQHI
jgi:hypothetical protein